ncbi:cytochrome P450 [Stratiformator vulcanicus]|uniref:Pentalenene oxygenase n=1 Tax=Stratiformator vulcanicus TaxID=2527980 RepID=A0A517R6M7_9PLAN|nr:cytochrome P450 [Stratiformator vulcanicus]QDT39493.1 Pentalenene oxygenase [Stratiformator vulcanicus]
MRSVAEENLPVTVGDLRDFPKDPIACMRALHEEHGAIAALQDEESGQRVTFVFSPEHNKTVLSDAKRFQSRFFTLRGSKRSSQRRVTSGLLSMNGDQHRRHRRMVKTPFSKPVLPDYQPAISGLVRELLDSWSVGDVRDIHHEMNSFMLRVTSAILFGLDDPDLAFETGHLIDEWVHKNHEVGVTAFIADTDISAQYDNLLDMAKQLEHNVTTMLQRRRQSKPGPDVLSLLIQARDAQGSISSEELIGHVALLFGAAHLTTAHSLTWTLLLLAQHPSVMADVFEEIDSGIDADLPTQEQTERLPLMEKAIKESMRCLPASSYSQRITAEPVELGPLTLGCGSPVVFSQYITHHRSDLFKAPDEFRPGRWEWISPGPYEYLPFGSGPRMCLGAGMAMTILKTTLPAILKKFRVSMVPGSRVDARVISTMLGPTTPVPMLLSEPDGKFEAQPISGTVLDLVDFHEMPTADEASQAA